MSLGVCLVAAVGSAVAYGGASAAQHSAASFRAGEGDGDLRGLVRLLRDPRWWLGTVADVVGVLLQVLALSQGAVSVVQPLQVLGLLVALPVGTALGGPRGTRRTAVAALVLTGGLAGFLVVLGDPGDGRPPASGVGLTLGGGSLGLAVLALAATRAASAVTRAVVHGAASGALFAVAAVLLRMVTLRFHQHGLHAFSQPGGYGALLLLPLVAVTGTLVAQRGFQLGPLSASLPTMTAVDPVVSVALGRFVLGERLPLDVVSATAEVACLVAVALAARVLARAEHPG